MLFAAVLRALVAGYVRRRPTAGVGGVLVPELFAVPVDWGVGFDFEVTTDAGLAGESDIFAGVAEDFEAEEWVEPFPEAFEDAFG